MTEIAHGEINIDVRDRDTIAALRRIDSEFDRTMNNIDRQHAAAKADLDTAPFDQEYKNLNRKLRELEGKRTSLEVDGKDFEAVAAEIKLVEAERRKLDGKRATVELKVKGEDEMLKAQARVLAYEKKVQAEIDKAANRRLKQVQQYARVSSSLRKQQEREEALSERNRTAAIERRAKVSASLRKQEANEMRAAERAAYSMDNARTQSELRIRREADAIPKLRSEYVKLLRTIEGYDARRRTAMRSNDARAVLQVDIDQEGAMARFMAVKKTLEEAGRLDPLDIDARIHPGRDFGLQIRKAFDSGGTNSAIWLAGKTAGDRFGDGFRSRINRLNKTDILAGVGSAVGRGASKIGNVLEGLSSATIRLGPFTATIRQALIGVTALGPLIVDLGASLVSLGGVLGSATLGLGALSAGFLGGAIPAAIGMFTVLKPVVSQFKSAMAATKSYNDTVAKNGASSEKAKKKLAELESVLGHVDAQTKRNFISAGKMRDRWEDLTKPARNTAFKILGDGLSVLTSNLDMFGKNTNETFAAVEQSTSRWFKGLRSAEGKRVLDTMWDNFNASLTPALDGLGNLGAALGKLGAVASTYLPGFAAMFRNWSAGVNAAASDTGALDTRVRSWIESLKSVGNFLRAIGNLTATVFGGGVKEGRKLTDTMTNAMNRWTTFLKTTEGQEGLQNFFSRARSGAQALFSLLGPIVSSFVSWANAVSPLTAAFFKASGIIAGFVQSILSLTVLRGPLTAIAATLGTLWAVSRISSAAVAVGGFTRALIGLQTAATATEALSIASGAAAARTTALGAAGATAATRMGGLGTAAASSTAKVAALEAGAGGAAAGGVGTLRAAATRLVPAIAGLGAIAGGAATLGIGALAAGAVYGAYKLVTMKDGADKARDSIGALTRTTGYASKAYQQGATNAATLGSSFGQSNLQVKSLREQLAHTKRGTDEYKATLYQLRDAVRSNAQLGAQWTGQQRANQKSMDTQQKAAHRLVEARKKLADIENAPQHHGTGRGGISPQAQEARTKQIKAARVEVERLAAAAERADNRVAAGAANAKREYLGLAPVLGKAEQQLGKLARSNKGLSVKIATKFENPKDAGKVAAAAQRALKSGTPKSVTTRAVVDSKNAEDALRRLRAAKITPKRLRIIEDGGAKALAVLKRIVGTRLAPKVQHILGQDTSARTKIKALIALGIPPKTARMLGDNKDALRKAAQANAQRLRNLGQRIIRSISNPGDLYTVGSVIQKVIRKPVKFAEGGMFASGGVARHAGGTGAGPDEKRLDRAEAEAARRAPRDIRAGGKVSRPTMLVGEENKSEYVIATNPRYRARSLALLKSAASSLGVSASAEVDQIRARTDTGIERHAAGVRAKDSKRKKGKKTKFRNAKNSKWLNKVEYWQEQEDNHNREVAIKEMRIDEPESFVYDTGSKAPDGSPIVALDEGKLQTYLGEMGAIKALYEKVVTDILNINTFVGKARSEQEQNVRDANANLKIIRHDLSVQRKRASNSKASKASRNAAKKAIPGLEKQERDNERAKTNASEDVSSLKEEQKDAPWRQQEAQARLDEYKEDIDAVRPKVEADVAKTNESGSSGSAASQLSYGEQVAAAAGEEAAVLRDFAGNAGAPGGPVGIAAGGPSTDVPQSRLSAAGTAMGAAVGESAAAAITSGVSGPAVAALGSTAVGGGAAASVGSSLSTGALSGAAPAAAAASTPTTQAPAGGETNVTVNNTFATVPPDPHTFSKGVAFEIGAAL